MTKPFSRALVLAAAVLLATGVVVPRLQAQDCLPDGCFDFKVVKLPPIKAQVGEWIDIEFNATCPVGKTPKFYFDWGDGLNTPADKSGEYYTRSHQYPYPGTYKWVVQLSAGCNYDGWIQICSGTCLPKDTFNTPAKQGGPEANPNVAFEGGLGPARCQAEGLPNYWVNTASLNVVVEDTLARYEGLGPEVRLTQTFNDNYGIAGMMGKGWRFWYESRIEQDCQNAVLFHGSGRQLLYTGNLCPAGTPSYPVVLTPPAGVYDRLSWHGDYWLWEEKETRQTWRYNRLPKSNTSLLAKITDSCGNALTVAYENNRIKTITDASGRSFLFEYGASEWLSKLTSPDNRTATFQYDSSGRMNRSADFAGTLAEYRYFNTNLTRITVGTKITNFQYTADSAGYPRLSSITDARGKVTSYTADITTGEVTVTDPNGGVTRYRRTTDGLTQSRRDPLGNLRTYTYDSKANLTSVTDELGGVTRFEYDTHANLTKLTDPAGKETRFEYDAGDRLQKLTNSLGGAWTFTYNSCQKPVELTSPAGRRTTMGYDSKGQLVKVTNPRGKATDFTYDVFGNVRTVTGPLSNQTRFSYDQYGLRLTSLEDARGNTTSYSYDPNDRLTRVLHPDGQSITFEYDCCASTRETDERGSVYSYVRDPLSNITAATDPLNYTETTAYDGNQNPTSFTNALSQSTTIAYDVANRVIKRTNALGGASQYVYDAKGNLVTIEDHLGNKTRYAYDARDLRVSTTDAAGKAVTLVRDAAGRVTGITNGRGNVVSYLHDADGRVTEKRYGATAVANYAYDNNGNLVTISDSLGTTTAAYDDADRLVNIQYPQGVALALTYDQVGNVGTLRYPGGPTVTYSYDTRNRLVRIEWPGGNVAYEYDAASNLTKETRSNGTSTSYEYDAAGQLSRITHKKGTQIFSDRSYERDALGRTVTETWAQEATPSLQSSTSTASHNNLNQQVNLNSNAQVFDADGNLTQGSSPAGFAASYDCENRLTSVTRGGVTTEHTYNGVGQRARSSSGAEVRNAYWDLYGRLLMETDGAGKVLNFYIYSGNRLAAMGTDATGYHFYHFDMIGNTIAMTDSTGNLSASYRYLPHGVVADRTGALRNPFTFVGAFGVMDEGQGLFFMRSRYYDALSGRFIQRDPIGILGGLNLYAYAGNNPVEKIDPLGLAEELVLEAFFGKLSPTGMAWLQGFEAQIVERGAEGGGEVLGNVTLKLINPHAIVEGSGKRATDPAVKSLLNRLLGKEAEQAAAQGAGAALGRGALSIGMKALVILQIAQLTGVILEGGGDIMIDQQVGGEAGEIIFAVGKTINTLLWSPIEFIKTGIGPINQQPTCDGVYRRPLGGVGHFY